VGEFVEGWGQLDEVVPGGGSAGVSETGDVSEMWGCWFGRKSGWGVFGFVDFVFPRFCYGNRLWFSLDIDAIIDTQYAHSLCYVRSGPPKTLV
jgi:hypothetical protein